MKRLLLAAAVVAVLAGLVLAALLVEYDAPRIGRAVLEHLSTDDVTVTAETFRLSPLRGVSLGDATVDADLPGGSLHATADALVLRHRFWPLLSGRLVADELEVLEPRVELAAGPPPSAARGAPQDRPRDRGPAAGDGEAPAAGDGPEPRIRIDRLTVEDATLVFGAGDEEPTEIRGADLELTGLATRSPGDPLFGLSGEGTLEAESYRDGSLEGRDLSGALTLGDGRLRFTELTLDADEGHFRLPSLVFDFGADPYTYELELVSDPLRPDALLGATSGDFGSGTLRFAGAGRGGPEAGIAGEGELRLEGGSLPANPTLSALADLLGRDVLLGREYEPLEIRFRLDGDEVDLVPFDLVVGDVVARFAGRLSLDGPLDLRAVLEAPRELLAVDSVPRELVDALSRGGNLRIPLAITGTAESPKVRPVRDAVLEAGAAELEERLRDELGEDLGGRVGKELRRLLGGGEEEEEDGGGR